MNLQQTQLPPDTAIAHVHVRVRSLEQQVAFYNNLLGFQEVFSSETEVALSPTGRLPFRLLLSEDTSAVDRPYGSPGLFHLAIRFPNRKELALTVARLIEHRYPLHGASDHLVSEAIYLADPEGNGVELYSDRPADQWKWRTGEIAMATEALDVDDLLSSAGNLRWNGMPQQTDIGHVHLSVSNLGKAEEFYVKRLGFSITTRSYPGALFMAAGGYHHHLGANIWMSRNAMPAPENTLGLVAFGISVASPHLQELSASFDEQGIQYTRTTNSESQYVLHLRDSDGIGVELIASPQ